MAESEDESDFEGSDLKDIESAKVRSMEVTFPCQVYRLSLTRVTVMRKTVRTFRGREFSGLQK